MSYFFSRPAASGLGKSPCQSKTRVTALARAHLLDLRRQFGGYILKENRMKRNLCAAPESTKYHEPTQYIRQREVLQLLPFSPATLWRKVATGDFVRPVKLGPRITAWSRAEVLAWLATKGGEK